MKRVLTVLAYLLIPGGLVVGAYKAIRWAVETWQDDSDPKLAAIARSYKCRQDFLDRSVDATFARRR